jgi:hypothetical protein
MTAHVHIICFRTLLFGYWLNWNISPQFLCTIAWMTPIKIHENWTWCFRIFCKFQIPLDLIFAIARYLGSKFYCQSSISQVTTLLLHGLVHWYLQLVHFICFDTTQRTIPFKDREYLLPLCISFQSPRTTHIRVAILSTLHIHGLPTLCRRTRVFVDM